MIPIPTPLLGALSGSLVGLGLATMAAAWLGHPEEDHVAPPPCGAPATRPTETVGAWHDLRAQGWDEWRWVAAMALGALTWLLTAWPVAALAAGVAVVGVPVLLSADRSTRAGIGRAAAVEGWSRRVADVLLTGAGLEQAVAATVRTCPDLLRPQVAALAARLTAGWSTETALRAFADDLDDASADLVVASLVLGARRRGPGLARTLTTVADSLAEEVTARRKVEAERAKPRATARAVTVVIVAVLAAGSLSGDYLQPYAAPAGQLVLGALLTALAGALMLLHRISAAEPADRLLSPLPPPGDAGTAVPARRTVPEVTAR